MLSNFIASSQEDSVWNLHQILFIWYWDEIQSHATSNLMKLLNLLTFISLITNVLGAIQIQSAPAIEISGNKFFNSLDHSRFFVRGIAYQRPPPLVSELGFVDSLALPSHCLKDLFLLNELGVNTVRVYQIDPAADHDLCMDAFAANGIYVFVDLSEPKMSINRENPSWDTDLYERYTSVIDAMHRYSNVIGFIAGNEVMNSVETSDAAPFVKASIRDMKRYIKQKKYRSIPIGYASSDESTTRLASASYFVCTEHDDKDDRADFYALNMFEWCGYSTYDASGYRDRTVEFSMMPVPVFFSEYGCNVISPRPFTEIEQIYGPAMCRVWSGGIVYELFQGSNHFGLVEENANGRITRTNEFNTVRLRLTENKPQGDKKGASPESLLKTPCPPVTTSWRALPALPPTPDEAMCECLQATFSCILTPYRKVHELSFLSELCALTDCSEILANGTSAQYGAFSGCGLRQKISFALNRYWLESNRDPEVCDFGKRAVLISNAEIGDLANLQAADSRSCAETLIDMLKLQAFTPEERLHLLSDKLKDGMIRFNAYGVKSTGCNTHSWNHVWQLLFIISLISLYYLAI